MSLASLFATFAHAWGDRRSSVTTATLCTPVQEDAGPPQGSSSSSSWRPLFDGHSLDGWEHSGPGKFVVEDVDEENETGEFDHASQIVERKVLLY